MIQKYSVKNPCRLCGNNDFLDKYTFPFCYVQQCENCNLIQVTKILDHSGWNDLYSVTYFQRGKYNFDKAIQREQLRRIVLLEDLKLSVGSKILDFGCATGDFVYYASKKKYECWGVDISSYAVEEAIKKNPNCAENLFSGSSNDIEKLLPDNYFDVITLWDVIEHIPDPANLLEFLKTKLKDSGALLISTPNVDAFLAKITGKYWAFMTPREHLSFFSKKTITHLLTRCDYHVIGWSTKGKWVNLGFLIYKLNKVLGCCLSMKIVDAVQKSFLSKIVMYVPTKDIQYVCAIIKK